MKIAVLFSGQIRGESYKNNIWRMKCLLPEADFFYSTWKSEHQHEWIHEYFDEPHIHYNCEQNLFRLHFLGELRRIKEETGFLDREDPHVERCLHGISSVERNKGRHRIKQHLAHTLAYERFVKDKDYDIVIRIRYDLEHDKTFTRDQIMKMIDLCHTSKKPVGVGYLGKYPHGVISEMDDEDKMIGDLIIVHRADMFDTDYVWDLFKQKKLNSGEFGWFQIMSECFDTNCYTANFSYVNIKVD